MASNKNNTKFAIHKPKFYELKCLDLYGIETIITGTPKQIINHIINHQL
jgi:hypothetical protein